MGNAVIDGRDQDFVLHEMLNIEGELCSASRYADFNRELFDMTLETARKLAVEEVYPTLMEADREGAHFKDGTVTVPKCYHRLKKLFSEGGWAVVSVSPEAGGQGFPYTMNLAVMEGFIHNFAFLAYPFLASGAGHLIEKYGSEKQKKKYMEKLYAGEWGGTMALTEPEAGSDVGSLKTRAVRQPDGTYRITGTKIFITSAENDIYENIIHPVLARIEGDPAGTKGISIFIVPKFMVNDDGTLGKRNDVVCAGIEHKMGLKASATCVVNFGDNGDCYAELLGEERQGMKIMFQLMNEARIGVGIQGMGTAGTAYLHALGYARERKQGANIMNMQNPDAPRAAIIEHADVRRMLLWMKSQVEGMRALIYFSGLCYDKSQVLEDGEEKDRWFGLLELLTPICKAYCSDIGFRVTELAIQVYGGYGYCQDYPVEQFMRDIKIASIYEGTTGIQALDLVGRKLGQRKGKNFMLLLGEIGKAVAKCQGNPALKELAADVQASANLLADMGMYFANCGKEGKFMIPVSNATPFLYLMGTVVLGWFHLWMADIAGEKLGAICRSKGIDAGDAAKMKALIADDRDAAFYSGKIHGARYFIKHILPEVDSYAKSIKSGDLSVMDIAPESFAV